jgi:hypothetical protein
MFGSKESAILNNNDSISGCLVINERIGVR